MKRDFNNSRKIMKSIRVRQLTKINDTKFINYVKYEKIYDTTFTHDRIYNFPVTHKLKLLNEKLGTVYHLQKYVTESTFFAEN